MSNEQTKGFINNLVAGAVWDGIKQLWGPVVIAAVVAVWQKLKHGSLDWFAIIGMFLVASILAFLHFRKTNSNSQSRATSKGTVADEKTGLDYRIQGLSRYINSDAYAKLSTEKREVLDRQLQLMTEYSGVVGERMGFPRTAPAGSGTIDAHPLALSPLQIEILQLAKDLQGFQREMGAKPEARKEDFEDTRNGVEEFIKADFVLQEPWLTKFRSLYNKRFALRLQNIVNELGVHGLKRGCLDNCARAGIDDGAEAQLVIETLVSAAYQLDDIYVFPRNVYSAEEIRMMPESEIRNKIATEPGFLVSYEQYMRTEASQASKGKKA